MPAPTDAATWQADYALPGKAQAVPLIRGTDTFGPVSKGTVYRVGVDAIQIPGHRVRILVAIDGEIDARDGCGTTLFLRPGDTALVPASVNLTVASRHSAVFAALELQHADCSEFIAIEGISARNIQPSSYGVRDVQSISLHQVKPGFVNSRAMSGNRWGSLAFAIINDAVISAGETDERLNRGGRMWIPPGVMFEPARPALGHLDAQVLVLRFWEPPSR